MNYGNEGNRLACVIVPFKTITAIKCSGSTVLLKVDVQPLTYIGSKQQGNGVIGAVNVYDKTQLVDISHGEIQKNPLHKLNFSEDEECVELPPPEIEKVSPVQKQKKKGLIQPFFLLDKSNDIDAAVLLTTPVVCACRTSCKSIKCSCVKATRKCNSGRSVCLCSNCDNPLNILDEMGIDPVCAVLDMCLLQNIYKLPSLRIYLIKTVKLGCCKSEYPIKSCIPGAVKCPNSKCDSNIQYSWCRGLITSDRKPRNHCSFCGQCNFWEKRHCLECNKCHSTSEFSKCPNCTSSSS
ncbi:uncharacterized protein LOC111617427 isoform X2 [Centruroides sculpturatus]|uniref:uncharacterized protein LOC111617427 isoform X2 n=1 Tax=Centruroides sculpturatus TaxID=218467 RepID=UPI000C6D68A3|nr:uncharacterized protein LOC111617427 isoform X2 [Centruroides sculpturatus]